MQFASDSQIRSSLVQENNQEELLRSLRFFSQEEGFQGLEAFGWEVVVAVAEKTEIDQFPELFALKVGHKRTARSMLHYSHQRLGTGAPS